MQLAQSIFGHEGALQTRTRGISVVACNDQEQMRWWIPRWISAETEDIKCDMCMLPLCKVSPGEITLDIATGSLSSSILVEWELKLDTKLQKKQVFCILYIWIVAKICTYYMPWSTWIKCSTFYLSTNNCCNGYITQHLWGVKQQSAKLQQAKPDSSPVFKIKFHWNTVMTICFHIVYGCFWATTMEMSSCIRDHMAFKT